MSSSWILVILITLTGMFLSVYQKKLTLAGSFSGGLIALLVFAGSGFTGYIIMAVFFLAATFATSYRKKEKPGYSPGNNSTPRNAFQVWANSGMAAVAGAASIFYPDSHLVPLVIAAVFSSAIADTVSSEMGMVVGKRFFNILNFQPDQKGLDGVISLEGSLWGLAASTLVAVLYIAGLGTGMGSFFIIILAGTMGNVADSVLGALFERKGILGNNLVNLLNTFVAVLTALIFS